MTLNQASSLTSASQGAEASSQLPGRRSCYDQLCWQPLSLAWILGRPHVAYPHLAWLRFELLLEDISSSSCTCNLNAGIPHATFPHHPRKK